MVARVKDYKAGFVESDANLSPDMTLDEVVALKEQTGHSTMPVTDDGTALTASCSASSPSATIAFPA